MGGRRRPPTRGRPREPETQADTQDNTQPPAQPPAAPRASPAWLAAHFENVARRPQPTSERSGYETVRVVAARDADAENQGGELKISDGRHTCRVLVPPTVDAGQPLEAVHHAAIGVVKQPTSPDALNAYGAALEAASRPAEAAEAYESGLDLAPQSPTLMTHLGNARRAPAPHGPLCPRPKKRLPTARRL